MIDGLKLSNLKIRLSNTSRLWEQYYTLPKANTVPIHNILTYEEDQFTRLNGLYTYIKLWDYGHKWNLVMQITQLHRENDDDLVIKFIWSNNYHEVYELVKHIYYYLFDESANYKSFDNTVEVIFLITDIKSFVKFLNNFILIHAYPMHEDLYKN